MSKDRRKAGCRLNCRLRLKGVMIDLIDHLGFGLKAFLWHGWWCAVHLCEFFCTNHLRLSLVEIVVSTLTRPLPHTFLALFPSSLCSFILINVFIYFFIVALVLCCIFGCKDCFILVEHEKFYLVSSAFVPPWWLFFRSTWKKIWFWGNVLAGFCVWQFC